MACSHLICDVFQDIFGDVYYDIIGDDKARILFQIDSTGGQLSLRQTLLSDQSMSYTVSIISTKIGQYWSQFMSSNVLLIYPFILN